MSELSENARAALAALQRATADRNVAAVSRAVWKQFCGPDVHLQLPRMLATGAVDTIAVGYSRNGKIETLYRPA